MVGSLLQPQGWRREQADLLGRLERALVHLWLQQTLVVAIKQRFLLLLELVGVDHACSIRGFGIYSLALLGCWVEVGVRVA